MDGGQKWLELRGGEEKGGRILGSSKATAGQGDTRCLETWAGLPGCLVADWYVGCMAGWLAGEGEGATRCLNKNTLRPHSASACTRQSSSRQQCKVGFFVLWKCDMFYRSLTYHLSSVLKRHALAIPVTSAIPSNPPCLPT